MRPSLCLLLVGLAVARAEPASLPASQRAAGEWRVVTYNILGGRGTDNTHDLARVAAILRALNPDLVALQEVDRGTRRARGRDLPAELARLTGWEVHFAPALPFQGGEYGLAILSAHPLRAREIHPLPGPPDREPRVAAAVTVDLPGSAVPLRFFATHLDHLPDPAARVQQVAKLNALAGPEATPAVLAGDFNMDPGAEAFGPLRQVWLPTWPAAAAATYPSQAPRLAIDHVLVRPGSAWWVRRVVTGAELFPDDPTWRERLRQTSDHLPVVAELTWQP
jgi:endonuclease/exonuclease/phosphatase family metal-dependent hydrolase